MATVTIRELPDDLVDRIKDRAARSGRSMEQELRELLQRSYATRQEVLDRIEQRHGTLPKTTAEEVNQWIRAGRSRPVE